MLLPKKLLIAFTLLLHLLEAVTYILIILFTDGRINKSTSIKSIIKNKNVLVCKSVCRHFRDMKNLINTDFVSKIPTEARHGKAFEGLLKRYFA